MSLSLRGTCEKSGLCREFLGESIFLNQLNLPMLARPPSPRPPKKLPVTPLLGPELLSAGECNVEGVTISSTFTLLAVRRVAASSPSAGKDDSSEVYESCVLTVGRVKERLGVTEGSTKRGGGKRGASAYAKAPGAVSELSGGGRTDS